MSRRHNGSSGPPLIMPAGRLPEQNPNFELSMLKRGVEAGFQRIVQVFTDQLNGVIGMLARLEARVHDIDHRGCEMSNMAVRDAEGKQIGVRPIEPDDHPYTEYLAAKEAGRAAARAAPVDAAREETATDAATDTETPGTGIILPFTPGGAQ